MPRTLQSPDFTNDEGAVDLFATTASRIGANTPQRAARMNFDEFTEIVNERMLSNPIWFQLREDAPSELNDLSSMEDALNAQLPDEYKKFVSTYGSGHFAFGIVYSPNPSSELSLYGINMKNKSIRQDHVLFSESGTGDYYGFRTTESKCSSRVSFFDHESETWHETDHSDLFCFLSETALRNR
jgi:hypothetical protein